MKQNEAEKRGHVTGLFVKNRSEFAVLAFISESFDPAAVVIENFPLFPFGKRVIDKQGGEMVVYFDLLTNQVKWVFPD